MPMDFSIASQESSHMFRWSHAAKLPPRVRRIVPALPLLGLSLVLCGCSGDSHNDTARNVLYTSSNDPAANTIIAYSRAADGTLTPLSGSPFDLKGQGLPNPNEDFGPPDDDQQVIASADHKLLFAVNPGTNTIAVMNIAADGKLTHISGSPFPSGGVNPFSLFLLGSRLYCANKNVASGPGGGPGTPLYTVFNVASSGALTQIPGATVNATAGTSAAQILASPNGKVVFTNDFFGPLAGVGTLRSYTVNPDGSLTQVGNALTAPSTIPPGTPAQFQPLYLLTQGVQVHPTQSVFYACTPVDGKIAVYSYDTTGTLSFDSFAATTGVAPCWITFNRSGSRMYVASTGDNSISVMDTSNPLAPVELQHLVLKDTADYPAHLVLPILPNLTASGAAELAVDPAGQHLYVVSHRNDPDLTHTNVNFIHVLQIAPAGTLTEPGASVPLSVSTASHPHGVLVF
jgi:6-phosphogluconolactonase (cycloisomerase 2 family)